MATEAEYDEQVAPLLKAAADKAAELGISLVCRAEWDGGDAGFTESGPLAASFAQVMTRAASRARGNIDGMLIHLLKHYDCRASMFLNQYQKDRTEFPEDVAKRA